MLSGLSALLFTALVVLVAARVLPIYSAAAVPETSKIISIIGFHDAAFLIVGLLAARLADRSASGEELKKAAKTLADLRALHERIVESIRSGLITTDLDGTIYTFNAAAAEITGYTADEMRGKPISALLGNVFERINLSLEITETGDNSPRFETDILTPDGFAVHIGYNISPLFSETNETTGLIVTFQDLTEIRSMEESVRRKDRLAAVGRVAAGLAHEIRNPLGAMRGAIQVLESKLPPDSAQSSLIEIILRESDRLNKIIVNFLTYARPRVANFADTDINEAIAETVVLLKHSPDVQENHRIRHELPDQPIFIAADATQLKQIFWNLARNAIQAMPDGGELSIKLEPTPTRPRADNLHGHRLRNVRQSSRTAFRAVRQFDDRRHGFGFIHRLSNRPRPPRHDQRPQPRRAKARRLSSKCRRKIKPRQLKTAAKKTNPRPIRRGLRDI